jgi:hypothetical protein
MPTIRAIINRLPANGGSPITDIQHRINGGAPVSFGSNQPGSYDTLAQLEDLLEIRAINSVDPNPNNWSNVKSVVSGSPELVVNGDFTTQAAWAGTSGSTAFTINNTTGILTITNRGDSFEHGVAQPILIEANVLYDVVVTVASATGGGARIKFDTSDLPELTPLTIPGTYAATYTRTTTLVRNLILSTSQAAAVVGYSSISVRARAS